MAEIYLDPLIIVVATILIVGMIAFFDFLPYEKRQLPVAAIELDEMSHS
jgi:hypothetical protein